MKNKLFYTIVYAAALLLSTPAIAEPVCARTTTPIVHGIIGMHLAYPQDKRSWDMAQDLGVKWVRIDFPWQQIEKEKGAYDWTEADAIVAEARSRHIQILALLDYMPEWAIPLQNRAQKFAEFAQAIVSRYKDITYWEIFNEPNRPGYGWPNFDVQPEANAAAYADILKFSNQAIRTVNPAAVIISGGLSPVGDDAMAFTRILHEKKAGSCFDVYGYHPYGFDGTFDVALSNIFDVTSVFKDDKKPVWFTSYGTKDNAARERIITNGFAQSSSASALFWFTERDLAKWSDQYGLVDIDGKPKAEYALFKKLLAGTRKP